MVVLMNDIVLFVEVLCKLDGISDDPYQITEPKSRLLTAWLN